MDKLKGRLEREKKRGKKDNFATNTEKFNRILTERHLTKFLRFLTQSTQKIHNTDAANAAPVSFLSTISCTYEIIQTLSEKF